MRVVINTVAGGYSLSRAAWLRLCELGHPEALEDDDDELAHYACMYDRTNPLLLQVIDELGVEACSGECTELKVIDIPDHVNFYIEENYGCEIIHEEHRTWS